MKSMTRFRWYVALIPSRPKKSLWDFRRSWKLTITLRFIPLTPPKCHLPGPNWESKSSMTVCTKSKRKKNACRQAHNSKGNENNPQMDKTHPKNIKIKRRPVPKDVTDFHSKTSQATNERAVAVVEAVCWSDKKYHWLSTSNKNSGSCCKSNSKKLLRSWMRKLSTSTGLCKNSGQETN